MKHHVVNVKFYISFTRYLHDLKIERGSRDNTRFQIEDSDSPWSRYVSRFEKCWSWPQLHLEKITRCSITITTTTLSFQKTTIRLDGATSCRRMTLSITIVNLWTLGLGRILLESDVRIGARGAFRRCAWTWRMIRTIAFHNVNRDRLIKIQWFWSCQVSVLCDFTSRNEIVDLLYQAKDIQNYPSLVMDSGWRCVAHSAHLRRLRSASRHPSFGFGWPWSYRVFPEEPHWAKVLFHCFRSEEDCLWCQR